MGRIRSLPSAVVRETLCAPLHFEGNLPTSSFQRWSRTRERWQRILCVVKLSVVVSFLFDWGLYDWYIWFFFVFIIIGLYVCLSDHLGCIFLDFFPSRSSLLCWWLCFYPFFQVSLIVAKKTLFLYNLNDPENPIELAFQNRYGSIVAYKWYVVFFCYTMKLFKLS